MNECIEIVADRKWKRKMLGSNQIGYNIDYQTLFRITFWQCYPRWFIVLLLSSHTGDQNDYFYAMLFTFSLFL